MLGHEDVEGVGEGAGERRGHSNAVERPAAAPDLCDEREPAEGQRERVPEPPSYGLVDEEARPERDQHGGEVLDDERDPDVEVRDRREVEEVDEGEPADPENGEVAELPARDAKRARREDRHAREEEDRGAGPAHFGQPQRREPAGVDHDLGDGRVHGPECDRREDERVSERGAAVRGGILGALRDVEWGIDHGGGGYPGGRRSTLGRRGT